MKDSNVSPSSLCKMCFLLEYLLSHLRSLMEISSIQGQNSQHLLISIQLTRSFKTTSDSAQTGFGVF